MIYIFRYFLFLLIFLGVLSIERTLGLPFISLVVASSYIAPLGKFGKTAGIVITGMLLSVSYLFPLWLGIFFIAILTYTLEQRVIFFQRETLTYFSFVTFVVLLVAVVSHFVFSFPALLYHVCLAMISLFVIRYWFMKRTNKWKLS